jgi:RNA polymerase-binding transcription factor DksA
VTEIDKERVASRLSERADEIARRRKQFHRDDIEGDTATRNEELADYDQHPADTGTEMHEQELDETTDMILADEERQVKLAQERLADGLYGKCVDCGREIPAERLEAVPEAIRCIDDQRRYEAELRARGGPPAGQL